jgi:tetratricopeptide (TPR) repeat protein
MAFFLASLIVYSPAFHAGYIFDDNYLIRYNPAIRSLTNVPAFFVSKEARVPKEINDLQSDIYRPLQSVSYAASYYLWGDKPGAYHVENILLHAVNGALLFFLLRRLISSRPAAFLGALLFVVHPVQVEAVAYLSERGELLAAGLFLLSFTAFMEAEAVSRRLRKTGWYALSLGFYAASLLAKEMAITLPAILALYLMLIKVRRRSLGSWVRGALALVPYAAIGGLYFAIRTWNLGKVAQTAGREPVTVALMVVRVFGEYVKVLFFPFRLTFFHDINSAAPSADLAFYASLGCLVLALGSAGFCLRKERQTAFFLLAFLAALLPVSNLVPIKTYMQERFLYLPLFFAVAPISIILARPWVWLGQPWANPSKKPMPAQPQWRQAPANALKISAKSRETSAVRGFFFLGGAQSLRFMVCGLAIIVFGSITAKRTASWKDEKSLIRSELEMHPRNELLYYDLGYQYFWESNYDAALPYLKHAAENAATASLRSRALDAIGDLQRNRGSFEEAIKSYKQSVVLTPGYVYSLASLGVVYCNLGDYLTAIGYLSKAVQIWPGCANYNANLGIAYFRTGETERALFYWKRALAIEPAYPLPGEYRAMLDEPGR